MGIEVTLDELLNGPLRTGKLFHFTDTRNLDSIKAERGLLSLRELRRRQIKVPAYGGNELSHSLDRQHDLDGYVHLCFRANHPMEYCARRDGRILETRWLRIDPAVLRAEGVRFTLDVANKTGVQPLDADQALPLMDFEIIYRRLPTFGSEERTRLSIAERYEILVPTAVTLDVIQGL